MTNSSLLKDRRFMASATEHIDNWELANLHTMIDMFLSMVLGQREGEKASKPQP
jgi:hypothetical protein